MSSNSTARLPAGPEVEVYEEMTDYREECEVIEFKSDRNSEARESLSENFNEEIDTWARRALAANGFGDY